MTGPMFEKLISVWCIIAPAIVFLIFGYVFGYRLGRKFGYDVGLTEGHKHRLVEISDFVSHIIRCTELTPILITTEITLFDSMSAEMRLSRLREASKLLAHGLACRMIEEGLIEPRIVGVELQKYSPCSETVTIGASALIAPGTEWLNGSTLSEVISNLEQSVNIKYEPPRIIGKISSSPGCRRNV